MALRRPGDRAVLLLARLLKSIDGATKNTLLKGLLNQSQEAKSFLVEAREIVHEAKGELIADGAAELQRGTEGTSAKV